MQCDDPTVPVLGIYNPTEQSAHVVPCPGEYWPAEHNWHSALDTEPTVDEEPAGQFVHVGLPAGLLAYFPALHSVQLETPDGDAYPKGQLMQFKSEVCPVVDKYVPAGHGMQLVCPELVGWYWPMGQLKHVFETSLK